MIKVNLLREKVLEPAPTPSAGPKLGVNRMGLLLMVLFVTVGLGLLWGWWHLDQVLQEKRTQIQAQQKEIARLQKIQITAAEYEKQKQALLSRIQVIQQLKLNQKGPVEMLSQVIAAIPYDPVLWLEVLSQKGNTLHLEGYSMTVETISDFIAALNRTGYFQTVDLEYFAENTSALKFALNCAIRPKKAGA